MNSMPNSSHEQDFQPLATVLAGLRNVFANKWKLLALSAVAAAGAYYYSGTLQPKFASTTTISIKGEVDGANRWDAAAPSSAVIDKSFLYTQYELMNSRDLAEFIASRHEQINCETAAEQPEGQVNDVTARAFALLRNITVYPVRNTPLFRITAVCDTPEAAKEVAELYTQGFIAFKQGNYEMEKSRTSTWVEEQIEKLQTNLAEAEEKLQTFKETENVYSSDFDRSVGNVEVEALISSYSAEQERLAQLRAVQQQIDGLGDYYDADELATIPRIRDDRVVSALTEELSSVTTEYYELRERYKDDHPIITDARVRYNELTRQLRAQVTSVARGIKQELTASESALANIERRLETARAETISSDSKRAQLSQLEENVQINRELYRSFMEKAGDLAHSTSFADSKISLVNRAYASPWPVSPNRKLWTAGAFVLTFMLFGLHWFVRGLFDRTLKTPAEVELKLSTMLLGFLPDVRENTTDLAYGGFVEDSGGAFAEGVRSIRTSLKLVTMDETSPVTLITSCMQNEGKSTVALNLAAAFGKLENVLLIDADVRRPALARTQGLPEATPGLIDFLSGGKPLAGCITSSPYGTFDFMPAGRFSATYYNSNKDLRSPLEMLSSKEYLAMLEQLRTRYDRIIIDSAPMFGVSDAKLIARGASQVAYVIAAFETDKRMVQQGLAQLHQAKANVAGVILNKVDARKLRHYGYGSYSPSYPAVS